ncbi:MAG: hypothetical protein EHM66_00330 [Deltaproteobacteria bacterium]|nr:MAG: hypothetical protein EHM66_00330 [Deltaproteobacteria bacterium]
MNQVYDPLAYRDRTGERLSAISSMATGAASNFFHKHAQWQKMKKDLGNDQAVKAQYFTTAMELLQEKGIDPSKFNVPSFKDERITPEDYALKLSESIQSAFVGSGAKLDQDAATKIGIANQPGIQESLAKQSFLDQNDPLNQINLNGMAGTPAPAGAPVSDSAEQISPMLADITGASQSAPAQEDEVGKYFDPLARSLIDDVRGGRLSAQAASTEMKDILKLKAQAQLSKVQKERDDAKANQRERDRMWEATVSGALGSNKVKVPGGGSVTKENISQVEIGGRLPKEFSPGAGGGGLGGVPKNPDEIKLQKAAIERLRQMNAGDFTLVNKEDAMGNIIPTYVPKPNSQSARILGDPAAYNEFVTKFLPLYAKAVGIEPPTPGVTRGAGF